MIRIGIIHISSSKIRLTLAEIDGSGYFKIIDELKTPIRLCFHKEEYCEVCEDRLTHLISTLRSYRSLCITSGAEKIIALATESFAKSLNSITNNNVIFSLFKDEFNITLEVLPIKDEIYYNYLGIINSLTVNNALLIEVTGSTTNLIWIKDGKLENWATIPMGIINLTTEYGLNDRVLNYTLEKCSFKLKNELSNICWLENDFDSIILIGDLSLTIAKIHKKKCRYPIDMFHDYELSDIDIHEIYNLLKSKDLKQRRKIEGMDLEMPDILFSAVVIFNEVITYTNSSLIRISNSSLREGLLYEYINKHYNIPKDMLDYSIYGILKSLNCNIPHAEQVYWICSTLFNELKPLHHLDNKYLKVLKTGAMLHDCGVSINYLHHHKHSFYIILNSYINKLTHKELLMSAAIASYHRFNDFQLSICQYSSTINKLDLKHINLIGVLLKISEGLDRTLSGSVSDIKVIIDNEHVQILLYSHLDLSSEIHQALRAKEAFKEVYDRELIITRI